MPHRMHGHSRTRALLETTARDVRYAARTLRRSRGFAMTAVAVLALAIGATTAMFSVLDAVLLRPLPYRSPDRLAMLWADDATQQLREGRSALWDVEQWRSQSRTFADMATVDAVSTMLTSADGVERITGGSMSANLLRLLGVHPVLGRGFSAEEAEQRQRLVLISDRVWRARFGGSPNVLGANLVLDGVRCQVIGVLPDDFQIAGVGADVWLPHASRPAVRGGATWFVVGRLRPAATFDQAQAEMSAVARRLNERLPAAERSRGVSVVPLRLSVVGPQSRLALWILGGTVFCVFLIAAANVTSLSLARGVARTREMVVRAALGASAGRVVRQLLAEGVLLALAAGVIGTLLAALGIRLVRAFGPANLPRLNEISLDLRVLGWALSVSVLAGVLVGLSPALATRRPDLRPSGADGGRSVAGGGATTRIRRALVVADFALAIVLLAGAGLLVRSWWYVNRVDPGFRPARVLAMELSAPPTLSIASQRTDVYDRVLEQIRAVPGVESAGIIDDLFSSNPREHVVIVEGDDGTRAERVRLSRDEVSTGFFSTVGTPLRRGRLFSAGDGPNAPLVAIVNETMARRSWPGRDAVGRRFKVGPRDADGPWYTVAGVVGDMRRQGLERDALPQIFVPIAQSPPSRTVGLFVRAASDDPLALTGAIRAAVRLAEKDASIAAVAPLEQQLGTYVVQRRFQTSLMTGFSVVALLMAAVGIFGLIQFSIATRTQEIAIRMAVGARAGEVFRMILGEGLKLSLAGLMLGLVGALGLGRAGASLLFGVTPTDPSTFIAVSVLLVAVAVAACWFPARRATRIEPIVALRRE